MPTETRMFVGQTGTQAFDEFAGFRVGEIYQLRYTILENEIISVAPDHVPGKEAPITFSAKDFNTWFVKRQ